MNFEDISFHDCRIHALAFNEEKHELLLDVDFITELIKKGSSYLFNIAPSTLVFDNAWDVKFDFDTGLELTIANISRLNPRHPKNIKYLLDIQR